jgi:hypothetical protein
VWTQQHVSSVARIHWTIRITLRAEETMSIAIPWLLRTVRPVSRCMEVDG